VPSAIKGQPTNARSHFIANESSRNQINVETRDNQGTNQIDKNGPTYD